ncbi:MAG: NADPH-dependent assimilatory sulfite reductase hemoprotein subunit [Blastochloris sp.]|nr:NADPH-dependent assimilatory sulfite reductase hemoprotein subunit [Blastochloris sp.]
MSTKSVEEIKKESRHLRGQIVETLKSDVSHFEEAEYQLLKYHGTYQQDDRDLRNERKKAGLDKAWSFMVRSKIPGGELSADQYLMHDKMADDLANHTLRITTRQGFQVHGILKGSLKECIARICNSGLTTWGACGDVVRNTMSASSPLHDAAHLDALKLAQEINDATLPKSRAFSEIWLDGQKLDLNSSATANQEADSLYGELYLPRKFKIAIAVPPRNDVDVFSNDIGFICHAPHGVVEGYNIYVGGGFGMSHGQLQTRPFLSQPLGYVTRAHCVEAALAIITTQRDFGNRAERKLARLKYLVQSRGIEWFRTEVQSRMKGQVEPLKDIKLDGVSDMLGWHEQGDGKWFCGVFVSEGRIKDTDQVQYRQALRKIAETFQPRIRLTANCNLILCDIQPRDRAAIDQILRQHGIADPAGLTEARRMAHACVALPTCGLSLAESERVFPQVMNGIDAILRELNLAEEPILFRMSGCPNGCSRPYNADISFVGRGPNKYAFFIGGSHRGDRLVGLEEKTVLLDEIPAKVRPYLETYARERKPSERFSDFWARTRTNGEAPSPEQFHIELEERAKRLAEAGEKPTAQA